MTGQTLSRISLWLWSAAATGSVILLAIAIIGREQSGGATLRPMVASESMSDAQARAIAENTVRVYERERNFRHWANVEALACANPEPNSMLATDIDEARRHRPPLNILTVAATGTFTRNGPVWYLNTFFADAGGVVFELHIRNSELVICGINRAPIL